MVLACTGVAVTATVVLWLVSPVLFEMHQGAALRRSWVAGVDDQVHRGAASLRVRLPADEQPLLIPRSDPLFVAFRDGIRQCGLRPLSPQEARRRGPPASAQGIVSLLGGGGEPVFTIEIRDGIVLDRSKWSRSMVGHLQVSDALERWIAKVQARTPSGSVPDGGE